MQEKPTSIGRDYDAGHYFPGGHSPKLFAGRFSGSGDFFESGIFLKFQLKVDLNLIYIRPEFRNFNTLSNNQLFKTLTDFFINIGEQEKLLGKGVYFLRTTPAGKGINPAKADDNEILFGEISDKAVPALNTLINNIYKPLVEKM